ncbi:hypothetical protein D9757_002640 [Collybiopsis confluens]|uniref:Uncharacterized protein n=1 Tax=Collybiopsis confluens TaxID=2823264 RepID=A0A8H5MEF2_9AGAR|nr:hypothetical protein D9757_002640 [Collybiopsis confluens]
MHHSIAMAAFINSVVNTIYTFFAYLFTLFSSSKGPRLSVTPFPADLECGSQHRDPQHGDAKRVQHLISGSMGVAELAHHHCVSPNQGSPRSYPGQSINSEPFTRGSLSKNHPSQMPFPPLQPFAFPAYPCARKNSDSTHSAFASPISRPGSAISAASSASDAASHSCSVYSSHVYVTPPRKKTHRKQSPIVWFKKPADITGAWSSSSLSSIQSLGSSISVSSVQRHRHGRCNSLQSIKHDPSMSYRRFTARSSRQKKTARDARPHSEDHVAIVRKVFVECGSEVDVEGGGARARLINRETVRSFGGMEVVDEEEEDEEPCRDGTMKLVGSSSSNCSTPESTVPLTPVLRSRSCSEPAAIVLSHPSEILSGSSLSPSMSTQLPYLNDRESMTLSSSLSIPLSPKLWSSQVQNRHLTARFSTLLCENPRVSVATWSDLVSFSSYGLNMMGDDTQQESKVENNAGMGARAQDCKWALNFGSVREENECLVNDSIEDSGADLAAVLDSISMLVGHGLDATLLLAPPRQFSRVDTIR